MAVIGVPTDDAVSFRRARASGPRASASASVLLRPYNPGRASTSPSHLSMIDHGDAPTVPGYHEETLRRIQAFLEPVHAAGVTPLCIGGDHSMVLAELRAAAAAHGPLALVHLDAHADVWDAYYGARYFHGTVFRRAAEEGAGRPGARRCRRACAARSTAPTTRREPARLGYDAIPWDELEAMTPDAVRRPRARARRRPARVPVVRHRLRRPRVRARHRHARGRRADERPGARLRARAARDRLPRRSTASRSRRPTTRPRSRPGWRRPCATRCSRCWRCAVATADRA